MRFLRFKCVGAMYICLKSIFFAAVMFAQVGPTKAQVDELLLNCLNEDAPRCVSQKDQGHIFKSLFLSYSDDEGLNHGHALARHNWRMSRELTFSLWRTKNLFSYELEEGEEFFDEDFFGEVRPGLDAASALTELEFHQAARKIGSEITAQAVIWGEHYRSGKVSALRNSITLIDDFETKENSWLGVDLGFDGEQMTFRLPAWEFDFSPTFGLIEENFERPFVLRCNERTGCNSTRGIEFYNTPSNSKAAIKSFLPAGERVLGKDVVQKWILIERENGETGYVNIYHLEIVPTYLHYENRTSINLRKGPGKSFEVAFQADLDGIYRVLDVANDASERGDTPKSRKENDEIGGNWYVIETDQGKGWVKGYITSKTEAIATEAHIRQRDKTLYFLSALFRFAVANSPHKEVRWQQKQNFSQAIVMMNEFRQLANSEVDNQAISFAHMISALSYLRLETELGDKDKDQLAIQHAREAVINLPLFSEPRLLYSLILYREGFTEESSRQLKLAISKSTKFSTLPWTIDNACDQGLDFFCY